MYNLNYQRRYIGDFRVFLSTFEIVEIIDETALPVES